MTAYHHPRGIEPSTLHGRPVLTLPRSGRVAIDADVLALWTRAHNRTLNDLSGTAGAGATASAFVHAALACLSEAGLLLREGSASSRRSSPAPVESSARATPLVSGIIISYESIEWLEGSIGTLLAQDYPSLEAIVVDNGSPTDPTRWIRERYPSVRVLRLPPGHSFASAVNHGVALSRGEYAAVLNPDIEMAPDAVGRLVRAAEGDERCAAVAAKLTFWWAPAFLNGIGNRVEDRSWGTDNFIGHLDLGQFDELRNVPSACFAAALIRRSVWDIVGPADEGFPMYYEDTEWCYRARLLGYRIAAAPDAIVQHVFGGKVRSGEESDLTPSKTRNAAYGRLRFALKLLDAPARRRFVRNYLGEDRANLRAAVMQRRWAAARGHGAAWALALRNLPAISSARRELERVRRISDDQLFESQREMPAALMWHGIPDLSRDVITHHYLPLIDAGRTRPLPECAPGRARVS